MLFLRRRRRLPERERGDGIAPDFSSLPPFALSVGRRNVKSQPAQCLTPIRIGVKSDNHSAVKAEEELVMLGRLVEMEGDCCCSQLLLSLLRSRGF